MPSGTSRRTPIGCTRGELPLGGIAVSGPWVYFGIQTLTGEVRRCPVTGCVAWANPGHRCQGRAGRPMRMADERKVYWLNFPTRVDTALPGSLIAAANDGTSSPKTLASDLKFVHHPPPVMMNSHHVFWADAALTGARIGLWLNERFDAILELRGRLPLNIKSTIPGINSCCRIISHRLALHGLSNCPYGSGLIHLPNLASYILKSNSFHPVWLTLLALNCPW